MDPHPLSKSTSVLASMAEITGTTLAPQGFVFFSRSEKANAKRKVTPANTVNRPATV